MNTKMWLKALRVIPRIDKDEWEELDIVSRWLIATRSAVLVMTFLSAALAGIFAFQDGPINLGIWLLLTFGLLFAHATNNLLNDYTDFVRGVDEDNYYRSQYGPQPLVHGLLSKRQQLTYIGITGLIALIIGIVLILSSAEYTWIFMLLGIVFVLFYTFPLKYIALGEIAVFAVWGPLMIGGGYYVLTGLWNWIIVLASLPYTLGVTAVIFGKHIDKLAVDKTKRIHTLPVVLGEKISRYVVVSMFVLQYSTVIYLIITSYFSWVLLIVLFAIPKFLEIYPMFTKPKPTEKPKDYPDVWPNWFVAGAFVHNRRFGGLFLLGVILDTVYKLLIG